MTAAGTLDEAYQRVQQEGARVELIPAWVDAYIDRLQGLRRQGLRAWGMATDISLLSGHSAVPGSGRGRPVP